jgi:perosamine synthetase
VHECGEGRAGGDERLAVFGGPAAVTVRRRERWRGVRPTDVLPIAYYAARGVNTMPTGGGPVGRFERRFAARTGSRYSLLMNSGTATLHSAFFAVGVQPGDEVIVPPYTFFATAGPLLQLGATPVFCDIDEATLTADPADIERRITPRTRAICVVHVWGNPAPLDRLVDVARRHGVALIEDCSHAHGASFRGRSVGTWGDIGCFSLQGNKPVSGGEAGVAITDDPTLFDRMLALGHNGRTGAQQAAATFAIDDMSLGLKYRPHLAAAVMASSSLRRLDELNRCRARNYELLRHELGSDAAVSAVATGEGATRGGYFEFVLRYHPERANGWPVGAFARAARAEGVPVHVDRYTRQGLRAAMVDEAALFEVAAGADAACGVGVADPRHAPRPVAATLADQLLTMPPMTRIEPRFVEQCARAFRKVAAAAMASGDLRDL